MLKSISLQNFKRFEKFSVKADRGNILVGPNNSGKSSILDALRTLDACYRFTRSTKPKLIQVDDGVFDGFEVPESSIPYDLANITRNYNQQDAILEFLHINGAAAKIWLHPERPIRFIVDRNGKRFSTSKKFRDAFPIDLIIVPPLSPLEAEEKLLEDKTVQRNRSTRLAARNFRNIWYREEEKNFQTLCNRVETAWDGIRLQQPELVKSRPPRLEMFFEEDRITREIQWAGFGFQVWLQIHTHLLRGQQDSILVLDEPDIYLHPDLQRRLYHDVREIFPQYFLATHATEIINEADTKEILVVNQKNRSARRIRSDDEYESMLTYIGSAENADFARIAKAKKVIFVEGNDAKIIRSLARNFGLETLASDQLSPIFKLGGFTQWRRAQNTVWAFKELLGIDIEAECVFDRDYRSIEEASDFEAKMRAAGMGCEVLERKEIENYLLEPVTIARLANAQITKISNNAAISVEQIESMIEEICLEYEAEVFAHVFSNTQRFARESNSKADDSTLGTAAYKGFRKAWATSHGRLNYCPGKDVLSKLLVILKEQFGVKLSTLAIARSIKSTEIDAKLFALLTKLNDFMSKG